MTWFLAGLVVAATFLMVARIPDEDDGGGAPASRGASLAQEAGCLSCHRIGSEGSEHPGGDLSHVGAQLTPAAIGKVLVDPPSGMPSYESLAAEKRGALMRYLSGLR